MATSTHMTRTRTPARTHTRTTLGTTAVACTTALVLAACSGTGGGHPNASGSAKAGPGTRVTVTETEFALKLSRSSFTPGTYTFVTDNHARITHALSVDGPGVADARTKNLQSGGQGTVTVTLKKGRYDLYCPVDGHKQLGMEQHITVG
ncbi:copper-binding protein [Streptomyces sp. NPDC001817]|uniref:copper-binding protein n=1 Tax=Streptomyces sp. NPDC001817 TaxID=3154398 RepID=UPI003318C8F0